MAQRSWSQSPGGPGGRTSPTTAARPWLRCPPGAQVLGCWGLGSGALSILPFPTCCLSLSFPQPGLRLPPHCGLCLSRTVFSFKKGVMVPALQVVLLCPHLFPFKVVYGIPHWTCVFEVSSPQRLTGLPLIQKRLTYLLWRLSFKYADGLFLPWSLLPFLPPRPPGKMGKRKSSDCNWKGLCVSDPQTLSSPGLSQGLCKLKAKYKAPMIYY